MGGWYKYDETQWLCMLGAIFGGPLAGILGECTRIVWGRQGTRTGHANHCVQAKPEQELPPQDEGFQVR